MNLNKLNQQWRQIMRDSKSAELKKVCEVEIYFESFIFDSNIDFILLCLLLF